MKNIKKISIFLFFVMIVYLFSSCALTPKVKGQFDESVPVESSAWLSTRNAGRIIGYNGIPVNWRAGIIFGYGTRMYQIPAGETLLEWNVSSELRGLQMRYSGKNAFIRFNFQPQKQYFFLIGWDVVRVDDKLQRKFGFRIYAYDVGEKIPNDRLLIKLYSADHFVGFAPFLTEL